MMKNINFRVQAKFFALLIFTLLLVAGCGGGGDNGSSDGTIKIGWEPNTESDLAGYRVYYGTSPGAYFNPIDVGMGTPSGGLITATLINLSKGQVYCIAVTAYDTYNLESGFSNEVCGNAG